MRTHVNFEWIKHCLIRKKVLQKFRVISWLTFGISPGFQSRGWVNANGLLKSIKDPNAKFAWIAKKWSFKWWEPKVQQDVFRWQNPSFSNNFAPKFKMTKKQEICFGCDFNKNLEIYWHKWLFDTFVVLSFLWSVITLSLFHKSSQFL